MKKSALKIWFSQWLQEQWYATDPKLWHSLAWPLEALFKKISQQKRDQSLANAKGPDVPVIIIGNIHAGGMGKSPVVQSLAAAYARSGFKVGVLLRGYQVRGSHSISSKDQQLWPCHVTHHTKAAVAGDEAVMHAVLFHQYRLESNIIVMVDPVRTRGADALVTQHQVDLILCDDGLQHYQLKRDCEIVVYQPDKGVGRGYLLPRGPLREPVERLSTTDFILSPKPIPTSLVMQQPDIQERLWLYRTRMQQPEHCNDHKPLQAKRILALAGIASPDTFFRRLSEQGFVVEQAFAYGDHHDYVVGDVHDWLTFELPIVMTMKDAVKIRGLMATLDEPTRALMIERFYVVPYEAVLEPSFIEQVLKLAQQRFQTRKKETTHAG